MKAIQFRVHKLNDALLVSFLLSLSFIPSPALQGAPSISIFAFERDLLMVGFVHILAYIGLIDGWAASINQENHH